MKKSTVVFLFLVALVVTFGCKKDDKETTPAVTPGLSLKYDGNVWTAIAGLQEGYYNPDENYTYIMAGNTTGQQVQIYFEGNSTGTYIIYGDDYTNSCTFMAGSAEEDVYSTLSYDAHLELGKVIITEYDKTNHTLSGTFYFDAYNINDVKKTFSEGKFTKVSYLIL
jgi:hypothetical protein